MVGATRQRRVSRSQRLSGGLLAVETSGGAELKRGLEYGVRAPVFYGNLREQTGENGSLRIPTEKLFCSYRHLRKSPDLREFTGECNLGFLYSSSLLQTREASHQRRSHAHSQHPYRVEADAFALRERRLLELALKRGRDERGRGRGRGRERERERHTHTRAHTRYGTRLLNPAPRCSKSAWETAACRMMSAPA